VSCKIESNDRSSHSTNTEDEISGPKSRVVREGELVVPGSGRQASKSMATIERVPHRVQWLPYSSSFSLWWQRNHPRSAAARVAEL
jgi:hypothetical protein